MGSRWYGVVIDASDPARLARWWAEVLGFRLVYEAAGEVAIAGDGDEARYPGISFVAVPGRKSGRNRIHLDLDPDDGEAEVERLVNMGARRVAEGPHEQASWIVLADPEGNEFCLLRARGH